MRPRLLDLYAGAGGASAGYAMAGFDVTGVDNRPQPRSLWSSCGTEEDARLDHASAVAEGWVEPWIEHRQVAYSAWRRIPADSGAGQAGEEVGRG